MSQTLWSCLRAIKSKPFVPMNSSHRDDYIGKDAWPVVREKQTKRHHADGSRKLSAGQRATRAYLPKEKNQRQDRLHKLTTKLVRDFDVIVLEDLQTANLMKNHQLARSIAAQSWREIRSQLAYKCVKYGKELIVVNPYKTSQICSSCGFDDGKHALDIANGTVQTATRITTAT